MFNKKGFEIQFNWIFVLVAGALILLFFASVVVRQKNVSETSTKATVLKSIEAIITGAGVSSDTISVIGIPDSNIEVGCNRISIGGVSQQFQNLVLFAPSSVKGDRLVAQTMSFDVPYKATNILLLTGSKVRYVIVGNNPLANEINKLLPSDVKKEFVLSAPPIKNENNYKVRFIVFEPADLSGIDLAKFASTDLTALRISGTLEKGNIEYYQKSGNRLNSLGSSRYIKKASLLAAIYADTLDVYKCNMQNTFTKLNLVTKIYVKKTEQLIADNRVNEVCKSIYRDALGNLNSIKDDSSEFNPALIDSIETHAQQLAGKNSNLQKNSCPLIY